MLTFNEERHIRRALTNAQRFARDIYVVDCFSTDRTCAIAEEMGAHVFQHKWENYSKQFAWALANLPIRTEWIWRQDADEYLTDALIEEIDRTLPVAGNAVNGFTAPCLRKFMGRYIKHGIVPLILLRLVRTKCARVENKMMDEHMQVSEGEVGSLKNAFFDDSLMTLTEWTQKHNGYATREAADLLCTEYGVGIDSKANAASGAHTASVRAKKLKYTKLPLFWRAFAFFVYRYFFRFGFLDGKEGFLWHFLQGFWYRTLADAKVFELKKRFGYDEAKIKQYLIDTYLGGNETGGVIRRVLLGWFWANTDNTDIRLCGVWVTNTNHTNQPNQACVLEVVRPRNSRNIFACNESHSMVLAFREFRAFRGLKNKTQWLSKDSFDSCDSCSKEKEYPCYPAYSCSKNKFYSCSHVAEERRAYAAA